MTAKSVAGHDVCFNCCLVSVENLLLMQVRRIYPGLSLCYLKKKGVRFVIMPHVHLRSTGSVVYKATSSMAVGRFGSPAFWDGRVWSETNADTLVGDNYIAWTNESFWDGRVFDLKPMLIRRYWLTTTIYHEQMKWISTGQIGNNHIF